MPRTILSVAFPLCRVGPGAVGGAEQVLTAVDAELVQAGYQSVVVACAGSEVAGELVATPECNGEICEEARKWAQTQHRIAIEQTLRCRHIDLIHFHGFDWFEYLPGPGTPVLATLHLPCSWYPKHIWKIERPTTYVNCVSRSQRAGCGAGVPPVFLVENGVMVDRFASRIRKRGYVLSLGRICPEKGQHLAIEAARRAGVPLILAGEVFRYKDHVAYFEQEILPRLDSRRRFIGPVALERKRRLMTAAKCLLVYSLVDETSSLVAMEALACGTPVIALAKGALPEIVDHGRTGFIVHTLKEMADAIQRVEEIGPEECRREARRRFSARRMFRDYAALYDRLLGDRHVREEQGDPILIGRGECGC